MRQYIFAFIIVVLSCNTKPFLAQVNPDEEVQMRAYTLIDSTISSLNIRTMRFNEELQKVNVIKKLDGSTLGKDVITENKQRIKDFLNYLEVYRTVSTRLKKDVEDSVEEIRKGMPSRIRNAFSKEFLEAYTMDQEAFEKYTLALTKFFSNVMDLFIFMETSKVAIKDNKFQFSDKEEYEKYNKINARIEKSNKKLITASANAQRAGIDANSMMQKTYGQIKK